MAVPFSRNLFSGTFWECTREREILRLYTIMEEPYDQFVSMLHLMLPKMEIKYFATAQ